MTMPKGISVEVDSSFLLKYPSQTIQASSEAYRYLNRWILYKSYDHVNMTGYIGEESESYESFML
jgi:hypothetical protein